MFSDRSLAVLAAATLAPLFLATAGHAQDAPKAPSYKIVKSIPLGGPDKWDFVEYDPSSNRVFVSHRTKVDVVDVASGKVSGSIDGIGESHGVAIVPSLGRGYADDAGAKTLIVFDLKTLAKIAAPAVGVDADAVAYDPATGRVFVMNADGNSVSAVDAASGQAIKTVSLGGGPEMAVADGKGKLFINVASTNEVVAFDTKSLEVTKRWSVPSCAKPHGLAMDRATDRLFVSCVNARMLVLNAQTGAVVADLPIGKGTDDAAFDPSRNLAYSSKRRRYAFDHCGEGPAKVRFSWRHEDSSGGADHGARSQDRPHLPHHRGCCVDIPSRNAGRQAAPQLRAGERETSCPGAPSS